MTDISGQIAGLSPEKRALLELLLQEEGVDLSRTVILPQKRTSDRLPLSFAQQRLWFLDQLEPGNPAYNIPMAVNLSGKLDIPVLEGAINEIVRRHEALRTTFATSGGQPYQVIAPEQILCLPVIDLRGLTENAREAETMRLTREEARRSFDLEQGPLLRAFLLKLGDQEHLALFTMHHIISDGWSIGVLVRELGVLYESFLMRKPSPLPELTIQYADYAVWQRNWMQGDVLADQLSYWKRQLSGSPPVLALPTDRPRPSVHTTLGSQQSFVLPAWLSKKLQSLCQQEGVTTFMLLLAAFQTLLYRYTGQDDICVGTPIANRTRAEIEDLIGFFVNTLALRTDLSGDPSFLELVQRVRKVTLEAYERQDIPFEMLVDSLQASREMSHTPLFQVMFALQNTTGAAFELPGLSMSAVSTSSGSAKFDLTLIMGESPEGIDGSLEYNVDLFDATTISRMLEHFQTLLEAITGQPEQKISRLPILTRAERQLLQDWNNTRTDIPRIQCLHRLFEIRVEHNPHTEAVVYQGQSLTFQQLNERANRLAHFLQRFGVQPEQLVGLCLERSLELIVGWLAILKSGAAVLPLDPVYPPDRLAFILEEAQVPVMLAHTNLKKILPAGDVQIVCLDSDWSVIAQEPDTNPDSQVSGENLAYVIYTSGSTGKPKGVMIAHRSATNLWVALSKAIYARHPGQPLRVSLNAPMMFDASVQQLVMLLSGHTLYIVPQEMRLDGEALLGFLRENRIDVLDCVPSQLKLLLGAGLLDGMGWIPCAILPGGEAIDDGMWQELVHAEATEFYNMYGPTECTVDSTICWVRGHPEKPSIGRPVANTRTYILDRNQQFVPVGVPGELYIGGEAVGRGYFKRPELLAEKFLPNPFQEGRPSEPGDRLYRTGDLVRYLPDGDIEYLGRIDQQVKVRGFRIELGEIEAVLNSDPGVQESVVLVREDVPGDKRLVAYLVPKTSSTADPRSSLHIQDLRRLVQEKLPEYMLPSAIVVLEALPLMANGKVDRRALPAPDQTHRELGSAYVAPRSPEEEILANLWIQVLGTGQVGIHDNFFELGGHSLLATQVMSRVRDAFQVDLPLRILFEAPTVAGLAEAVRSALRAGSAQDLPVQPISREGELPLSFGQQRLWFLDQFEPGSAAYHIPSAVRLAGSLNVEALERSLNETIRRHEALRTVILAIDGRPVQKILPELHLPLIVRDLRQLPELEREAETRRIMKEEALRPFDLARGPLLRAGLLRTGDEEHIALFTMHHIVSDGWSTGILVREIAARYGFNTSRRDPGDVPSDSLVASLPDLPIQYADYAHWQRGWLQGDVLETQLAYWKGKLGGELPVLRLPADRPRPSVQTSRGAHYPFTVSGGLPAALEDLSRKEGVTLFMTLLAAFKALLYRYSGQEDICVGTPIANRTHSEFEGLIGFFVNTLVMRTDLSGEPSFRELLGRVRETALQAYAHQDIPFEMLVNEIQPERDTSHSALFQAMFILQNLPAQVLELPGLTLASMPLETEISNFDLTLTMESLSGCLAGAIEYNTDLFDQATISRLVGHFLRLLQSIVDHPEQPVSRLPILNEEERLQLLETWNDTQADLGAQSTLHQLFDQQVRRAPDAPAVIFDADQLTYYELGQRANRLAHFLQSLGVGPDVLVGICIDRSFEMTLGLLGVLKSGGAYVPLDPNYPRERLEYMISDSRIEVLLTRERLKGDLLSYGARVVCLDSDWEEIARYSPEDPGSRVDPGNLAYVIYTSGSTGQPKGVMVPHRAVVNHNRAVARAFRLCPDDRVLQFATINFDTAVEEIFPTWLSGAALVLRPDQVLITGAELLDLIEKYRLTVLDLPTAYWHEWVYELSLSETKLPDCLRLVVVGGEKALKDRYIAWVNRAGPQVRWLNTYGPTESTIIASLFDPGPSEIEAQSELPIGRPIANVRLYVLDKHLQPVPVGVPGELYIGGEGLARGYLNQPELTRQKFIPDPFHPEQDSRLYQTGDLARFRPDGNLEYLGRIDQQVKVRGFRVELGEIEAALRGHPRVRDTVVLTRADSPEEAGGRAVQRLVAYIVPADPENGELRPQELREYLKDRLPEYMLPAIFVFLARLPLTLSGKVDRRALPRPEGLRPEMGAGYAAPRTNPEEALAGIWKEVLGLARVGIHDNFFELGGDSILSIQVIARANQAGLRLTPRQLFEAPTIAGLAATAGTGKSIQAEQGIVTGPLPLTPVQHWFFEQNFADPQHWNQALLFEIAAPLAPGLLQETVSRLLEHHDALRMRFQPDPGVDTGWRQVNAGMDRDAGNIPFSWLDLSMYSEDQQKAVTETHASQAQAGLELTCGPLLRIVYFHLGDEKPGRLLIVIHHLVVDGISWRILLEDFQTIYRQLSLGDRVELPAKTTSYRYWAEQLEQHVRSGKPSDELDYWLAAAYGQTTPLPVDDPAGNNSEASSRQVQVAFGLDETRALLQEVPPVYGTEINDALLTALAQTVSRWVGTGKVVIELEGHGREDILEDVDISRTVGWFTSLYPVILDVSKAAGPGEALKAVKEQLRRVPNHGIGYGLLRYLSPEGARLRDAPPPQLSFNYLGQMDQLLPGESPFRPAPESSGSPHSPRAQRSYLLEVNGGIVSGQLQFEWSYSENLYQRSTVEGLARDYAQALREIIDHCRSPQAGGYTPSDFPLSQLDQKKLDKILAKVNKSKDRLSK